MKALIYTKESCPYCVRAKQRLDELDIEYTELEISGNEEKRSEMIARTGRSTVPQIFLHIGGCDDLLEADSAGHLKGLLG